VEISYVTFMTLKAQFLEHQLLLKHLRKKKKKIVQYEPVIESSVTGTWETCEEWAQITG
jgi:hypothetical protein